MNGAQVAGSSLSLANVGKNAMHEFAWQSTKQEGWASEYYDRKRAEGKSHTVALRALANVWSRILFALRRDRTPYQSSLFEKAKLLHARRAA